MKQAPVVLTRNLILGLRQIKSDCAIFQHERTRSLAEEVLQGAS